jgi:hypothetical protein
MRARRGSAGLTSRNGVRAFDWLSEKRVGECLVPSADGQCNTQGRCLLPHSGGSASRGPTQWIFALAGRHPVDFDTLMEKLGTVPTSWLRRVVPRTTGDRSVRIQLRAAARARTGRASTRASVTPPPHDASKIATSLRVDLATSTTRAPSQPR